MSEQALTRLLRFTRGKALVVVSLLILSMLLAACGGEAATPTAVPAPTNTTAAAAPTDTTAPAAAAPTDTAAPAAAATPTTPAAGSTGSTSAAGKTIALVTINQQALFFNQVNDGAQKAADAAGAKLVVFNANNDPAAQNTAVENYVQQKVDAIIVLAIDVNGIKPALNTAKQAGIPVIAVDAVIPDGPQDVQVGVDNKGAGKQIGDFFVNYVKSNMGGKAELGIVGALNSAIQNLRLDGFKEAYAGNSDIKEVGTVDGRNIQDNALTAAENLITGNPTMNAVYATGEPALIGAISAVTSQNAQSKVKVFGWDLTAQAIKGIDEGWVVAVVQQDPETEGKVAVESAAKLINKQTVEKTISVPITIVTKDNVDKFRSMFGGATPTPAAGGAAAGTASGKTVALVTINQQALFFNQVNDGAQKAADAAGAKLVVFNANNDPAAQNTAVENYVQQKVDAIIVLAIDVNGIKPALNTAKQAGIPVIAVDAVIPDGPQDVQVGVDNKGAGKQIGDFFVEYVNKSMGGKAELGIVGALNSAIQNLRLDGFKSSYAGNAGIKEVGTVDGRNIQDNALTAAENLITGNPTMNAVYATGEPALIGAISAVTSQNAQSKVKVFGWDLTAQAIKGIDEGWVVAVVQQDPETEGKVAVESAVKLINKQTVDKTISVPITIVTKDNVDKFRSMFK